MASSLPSSHFYKLQFVTWLPFPTEDHLHEIFHCRRALLFYIRRAARKLRLSSAHNPALSALGPSTCTNHRLLVVRTKIKALYRAAVALCISPAFEEKKKARKAQLQKGAWRKRPPNIAKVVFEHGIHLISRLDQFHGLVPKRCGYTRQYFCPKPHPV